MEKLTKAKQPKDNVREDPWEGVKKIYARVVSDINYVSKHIDELIKARKGSIIYKMFSFITLTKTSQGLHAQ